MTPEARTPEVVSIVSGGLSILGVHCEFHHDAEDQLVWTVRLIEGGSGRYQAVGQLRASGKSSRGNVDVAAGVKLPSELVDKSVETIKDAFPNSYLNHGLYDMAAAALRTALGLIASDLRISAVTPETVMDVLSYAKLQELRKKAQDER